MKENPVKGFGATQTRWEIVRWDRGQQADLGSSLFDALEDLHATIFGTTGDQPLRVGATAFRPTNEVQTGGYLGDETQGVFRNREDRDRVTPWGRVIAI